MAEKEKQGTGKHPHKSTEEPYPHHEAPTTRNEGSKEQGHSEQHSSGRSEEHSRSRSASAGAGSHGGSHENRSHSEREESSDLKEREYRDADGNVHHHTTTYMEQHKGENK